MTFARTEMLFLLWALPLLAGLYVYARNRRRRILGCYARDHALAAINPEGRTTRRTLKAILLLGALAALVASLAGVQYGHRWQTVERRGVSLMIALDCSKSMLATDIEPSRLERAKREIWDLLDMLRGDKAGLVAFAGTAFLQCPLTLDYSAFTLFLNTLAPDYLPVGGTNLAEAIRVSLASFEDTGDSEKAVIIITDGEATKDPADVMAAAREAADAGVTVFCIGVGSEQGAPLPDGQGGFRKDENGNIIMSKLDEATLRQAAALTGGVYVRSVSGDMDLEAIYTNEIRAKMQTSRMAEGRKRLFIDRYQWFLALAVALLVLDMLIPVSSRTRRGVLGMLCLAFLLTPAHTALAAGYHGNMEQGLAAYQDGEYEQALDSFLNAQIESPDDPAAQYNIGNTYYRLGQYEDARKNYLAALETDTAERGEGEPASDLEKHALFNLGNTSFRLQEYDKALDYYKRVLEIDPQDEDARKNVAFVEKMLEEMKKQQQNQDNQQSGDQPQDQQQDSEDNNSQGNQSQDSNSTQGNEDSQDQQQQQDQQQDQQQQDQQQQDQQQQNQQQDQQQGQDQNQEQDSQSGQDQNSQEQNSQDRNKQDQESRDQDKSGQQDSQDQQQQESQENNQDSGEQQTQYADSMEKQETQNAEPGEQQAGQEQVQAGQAAESGETGEEQKAVGVDESMLNSLEDKPGKAFITPYGPRRVDKDW